jgi:hypothetical protein
LSGDKMNANSRVKRTMTWICGCWNKGQHFPTSIFELYGLLHAPNTSFFGGGGGYG